jgi:hypothetical protein
MFYHLSFSYLLSFSLYPPAYAEPQIISSESNSTSSQLSPLQNRAIILSQIMTQPASRSNKQTYAESNSIPVPVIFKITLQGTAEESSFGLLEGTLEIQPAASGDPNPFLVALYMNAQTDAELVPGSIFWQSFTAGHPQQQEQYSRITVTNNQVRLDINPSQTFRSDVMWFTAVTGTMADYMRQAGRVPRSSVSPTSGTLTFSIQGDRISGEIQATGETDLGLPSTYRAQFTGQRIAQ